MARTARTPYREALNNSWTAAQCVEHEDTSGNYASRDYYVRVATMWALIAMAEKSNVAEFHVFKEHI